MKVLNKIGLVIIIVFFVNTVLMLFILYDGDIIFDQNSCSALPLVVSVDDAKLFREIKIREYENSSYKLVTRDYFFSTVYQLLKRINIRKGLLDFNLIDTMKIKICDIKNILINKFMHQSSDFSNSDMIANTTIITDLYEVKDKVYWVIQLGAFKNYRTVFEIVNRLQLNNYLVYTFPEFPQGGEIVRIFVGPDSSKENLESLLDDLYFLTGLSGKIIQFSGDRKIK